MPAYLHRKIRSDKRIRNCSGRENVKSKTASTTTTTTAAVGLDRYI